MKLLLIVLLTLAVNNSFANQKENILLDLIMEDGKAFSWFKRDYARAYTAVYGNGKAVKQTINEVFTENRQKISELLFSYYSKHFSSRDLAVLSSNPHAININRKLLMKIYNARKSSLIVDAFPSFFDKFSYSIESRLDDVG